MTLVDLDPAMTGLSDAYPPLAALNNGAFADPRVTVVNQDAFVWAGESSDAFDAAVVRLEGLRLGAYRFAGGSHGPAADLARVEVVGTAHAAAVERATVVSDATAWARDLTNTRASTKTPAWLAEQASRALVPLGVDGRVEQPRGRRRAAASGQPQHRGAEHPGDQRRGEHADAGLVGLGLVVEGEVDDEQRDGEADARQQRAARHVHLRDDLAPARRERDEREHGRKEVPHARPR